MLRGRVKYAERAARRVFTRSAGAVIPALHKDNIMRKRRAIALHRARRRARKLRAVAVPEGWLIFAGSTLALFAIGLVHSFILNSTGLPLLMAPFGASAVLLFAASQSPLARPKNVIGGHVLSAFVGVTAHKITLFFLQHAAWHLPEQIEILALSAAVGAAIALMYLTGTLHPPGGATAFVAMGGGPAVHDLGYCYVLTPCAIGAILLVGAAWAVNNLLLDRNYPLFRRRT